jgi:hypothetical protein
MIILSLYTLNKGKKYLPQQTPPRNIHITFHMLQAHKVQSSKFKVQALHKKSGHITKADLTLVPLL